MEAHIPALVVVILPVHDEAATVAQVIARVRATPGLLTPAAAEHGRLSFSTPTASMTLPGS